MPPAGKAWSVRCASRDKFASSVRRRNLLGWRPKLLVAHTSGPKDFVKTGRKQETSEAEIVRAWQACEQAMM